MADDWDLYAVVRSCTSAAVNTTTNTAAASNDFTNEVISNSSYPLAGLAFEKELDGPFSFPNLSRKSGSLQDSYQPFLPYADPTTTITTTTTTNQGIDPTSSSYVHGGSSGLHHQHLSLHHHHQQQPTTTTTTTTSGSNSIGVSSPLTPTSTAPIFTFGQSGNQLQPQPQQRVRLQDVVQIPTAALPLRNLQSQAPRSRKRKNQQKRTVCHVTADNLSSDPWAWRKYGQKPIKGSPYPRNYYRCSSSKGCAARKQVERSNLDPNSFIVTYTGDHTHPRPTHRNSLAGSTRNKPSSTTIQKGGATESKDSIVPETLTSGGAANSCSSPRSAASLSPISPTTPLSAPENAAAASVHNAGDADNGGEEEEEEEESVDMALEEESEDGDGDGDDDDILIPNVHLDDDLFKGLEELVGGAAAAGGGR